MSRLDNLLANYKKHIELPWPTNLAPAQRVLMAVYAPEDELRLRLRLPAFKIATEEAGHQWGQVDISGQFERWMAQHEYKDSYFESPTLIGTALAGFVDELVSEVRSQLSGLTEPSTVVGLIGAGALFGLGDAVRLSALVERVEDTIAGRLLVFFPGEHEGNNYRLLGARDGWNYLATPIMA
jgi:hypothetical protein